MEAGPIWKDVAEPPGVAPEPPAIAAPPATSATATSATATSATATSAEGRTSGWFGVVPAVCAVHCLAMPILASTLPFLAATHAWEGVLLALSALLAAATLAASWRLHGRWAVWAIASLGFAVWIAAVSGWLDPLPESLMSPVGGLLVAASLFWSGHLRHQAVCGACACPVHAG